MVHHEVRNDVSRRALLKAGGLATAAELFTGELAHFFGSRMGEDHEAIEAIEERYLEEQEKDERRSSSVHSMPQAPLTNGATMTDIIGISGSLRRQSYNSALLRAAAALAPAGTTLHMRSIAEFPLYNGDVETEHGVPAAVETLKNDIAGADALLICTPEYNNAMPGVLKNAIDWLSRPPADIPRVFGGRPVAIMGASAGRFGTILAQNAWLPVLRTLGMQLWTGAKLMVPSSAKVFDAEGNLADEAIRDRLRDYMADFSEFVDKQRS